MSRFWAATHLSSSVISIWALIGWCVTFLPERSVRWCSRAGGGESSWLCMASPTRAPGRPGGCWQPVLCGRVWLRTSPDGVESVSSVHVARSHETCTHQCSPFQCQQDGLPMSMWTWWALSRSPKRVLHISSLWWTALQDGRKPIRCLLFQLLIARRPSSLDGYLGLACPNCSHLTKGHSSRRRCGPPSATS